MIKFHRPYEDYEAGDVAELEHSLEDMLVRQNYANVVDEPKPKKAVRKSKQSLEGEEA